MYSMCVCMYERFLLSSLIPSPIHPCACVGKAFDIITHGAQTIVKVAAVHSGKDVSPNIDRQPFVHSQLTISTSTDVPPLHMHLIKRVKKWWNSHQRKLWT